MRLNGCYEGSDVLGYDTASLGKRIEGTLPFVFKDSLPMGIHLVHLYAFLITYSI